MKITQESVNLFLFQYNAKYIFYLQRVGYSSNYPVYALHHGEDTVTVWCCAGAEGCGGMSV